MQRLVCLNSVYFGANSCNTVVTGNIKVGLEYGYIPKTASIMNEGLLSDWNDTVGLTVERVEEYVNDKYDEQVVYTIIFFTNEKFVIQKDQSGCGPTSAGLADQHNYIEMLLDISKSKRIK